MAAPSSAYNGLRLADKVNSTEVLHSEANTFGDDLATIKSRFYLDDVFPSQTGFIGCCYAESLNNLYHNASRYGSLAKYRETVSGNGDWKSCKLFVDAGLNTLANPALFQINSLIANRIKIDYRLASAYYVDTTNFGLEIKLVGAPNWQELSAGFQAQNVATVQERIFSSGYAGGDVVNIRAYATNAEGKFVAATQTVTLLAPQFGFLFLHRTTSCEGGIDTVIYMLQSDKDRMPDLIEDPQIGLGIMAYKDIDRTIEIDSGFYAAGNDQYVYSSGVGFTTKNYCPVGPDPTNKVLINVELLSDGTWNLNANGSVYASDTTVNLRVSFMLGGSEIFRSFNITFTYSAGISTYSDSGFFTPPTSGTYDAVSLNLISVTGAFTSTDVLTVLTNNI